MGPTAVLLLLFGASAPPADAIELRWNAPPGCPDREALSTRIRARVGEGAPGPAAIAGTVTAAAGGYALALELAIAGASTRRELEATSCDELVDAAALIVAVALDPVFTVETPAFERVLAVPEPARPRRTTSPLPVGPVAPPSSAPTPRRRTTMRALGLALRPSAGAWFGALPRASAVIGFDLVFPARRSLRAELGVLGIPRQQVDVAPQAGARLWLVTAVARACFAPAVGRVRPMGCAGISSGAIGGRGTGDAVEGRPGAQPWVSATAGAGLGIILGRRIELFVRGEGHLHLRLAKFHLDAVGSVHRVGATSVTALAGLQAVLP